MPIQRDEEQEQPKPLLSVVHEFGEYKKGDRIYDADEAERILALTPNFVVKLPQ